MLGFSRVLDGLEITTTQSGFRCQLRSPYSGLSYYRKNSFEVLRISFDFKYEVGTLLHTSTPTITDLRTQQQYQLLGMYAYYPPYFLTSKGVFQISPENKLQMITKHPFHSFASETEYYSLSGTHILKRSLATQQRLAQFPLLKYKLSRYKEDAPCYSKIVSLDSKYLVHQVTNYNYHRFLPMLPIILTMTSTSQLFNIWNHYQQIIRTPAECQKFFMRAYQLGADVLWIPSLMPKPDAIFCSCLPEVTELTRIYLDVDTPFEEVADIIDEISEYFQLELQQRFKSSSGNYHGCFSLKTGAAFSLAFFFRLITAFQLTAYESGIIIDAVCRNPYQAYFCPGPIPISRKSMLHYAHFQGS